MLARASRPVAVIGVLLSLAISAPATAADESSISYVDSSRDRIRLLVSVPPQAEIDFGSVTTTIDDQPVEATAKPAGSKTDVPRTTILVLDTSNSMRRMFGSAQDAAKTYLGALPEDVNAGVISFADSVSPELQPTLDRDLAGEIIDSLQLSPETHLYDGVLAGVAMARVEGQRSLLVLSDGADTSDTPLESVINAVSESGVHVDVVSLGRQKGPALQALERLTAAGDGSIIEADPDALGEVFTRQADTLGRQVLVTTDVPDSVDSAAASIEVTLPSDQGTFTAQAYAPVRGQGAGADDVAPTLAPATSEPAAPRLWMYAGLGAVGLGLLSLLLLAVPGRPKELSPEERLAAYTGQASEARLAANPSGKPAPDAPRKGAADAAAKLLSNNGGLEARIATRLDAAGTSYKPAEWLVLHTAIFAGAGLLGLLLGRGSLGIGILFLVLGTVGPWLWLKLKAGKRRKSFDTTLPETLQLMSGSLSAGLSLAQSIDTIVREGVDPVSSEFRRVLIEARLGVELEDSLDDVAERFESKDFAWVVMAIRIQRQVGGNLAELLDTVAATIREREYMRRQVRALAAEGKLSAWVLGGLPPGFLLYLVFANRDYVMPLFTEPIGWIMLSGAALILSVGVFWMTRIIKVEV